MAGALRAGRSGEVGVGSQRPGLCPHATPAAVGELILQLQLRYTWGARKVRRRLLDRLAADQVPTNSTVRRILERYGRVRPILTALDWLGTRRAARTP